MNSHAIQKAAMGKKMFLVTGFSSGIGQASASALANAGCALYRSVRELEHAQSIKGATLVQLDVCEQASNDRAAATIIAREGLSGSLDHEVREFGVRVTLVQPSFTNTGFNAISRASDEGTDAALVASTIVEAVLGKWNMRRTPAGQASLLAKLRRFMPAAPVDSSLRMAFGLPKAKAHIGRF